MILRIHHIIIVVPILYRNPEIQEPFTDTRTKEKVLNFKSIKEG